MNITRGVAMMAAAAAVLSFAAPSQASTTQTFAVRVSSSHAPAPSSNGCPNAITCGLYSLEGFRWPAQHGVATIRYSINPFQPWISFDDAVTAVEAAAMTWAAADPRVRFEFLGSTTRIAKANDGFNDIGWTDLDPGVLAVATVTSKASRVVEADVQFNIEKPWNVTPCVQRNGSCTQAPSDLGMISRFQVQAVASHELGHWLGLADVYDQGGDELTMYESVQPGDRKQETLGLGEVRGVRSLYTCRGCRFPAIYRP